MKISFQNKKGFTLIEMLIATAIFGMVILATSTIFGSSSRLQVSTKSAIANKQFASSVTDRIFSNLKSSNGWGKVTDTVGKRKIKGFGFFEYKTTPIPRVTLADRTTPKVNLIIGFENSGSSVVAHYYYFNSNKEIQIADKTYGSSQVIDALIIDGVLASASVLSGGNSKIEDLKITGRNYFSSLLDGADNLTDASGRYQPLVTLDLNFIEVDQLGHVSNPPNKLQVKTSISSRNYLEEPN